MTDKKKKNKLLNFEIGREDYRRFRLNLPEQTGCITASEFLRGMCLKVADRTYRKRSGGGP